MMTEGVTLVLGDVLKIERRFVVDGVVKTKTDRGVFAGVQAVGSAEHIVIASAKTKGVRLVPLHSVSEITVVKAVPRKPKEAAAPSWDPSFV